MKHEDFLCVLITLIISVPRILQSRENSVFQKPSLLILSIIIEIRQTYKKVNVRKHTYIKTSIHSSITPPHRDNDYTNKMTSPLSLPDHCSSSKLCNLGNNLFPLLEQRKCWGNVKYYPQYPMSIISSWFYGVTKELGFGGRWNISL